MGVKSRGAFCAPSCTHHGKRRVQMLLSSNYNGWYTAQVEISSHKDGLIVSETKGNYPDDYIYDDLPDNGGSGMFGERCSKNPFCYTRLLHDPGSLISPISLESMIERCPPPSPAPPPNGRRRLQRRRRRLQRCF